MRRLLVLTLVVMTMLVTACSSIPAKLQLSPGSYVDSHVRIEYSFGTKTYYIRIGNLTESELFVDVKRCSIISVGGETRNLNLAPIDSHIPPKATIVLEARQDVFFATDIDSQFRDELSYEHYISDTQLIREMVGQTIRIYLPIKSGDQETVYDIALTVQGTQPMKAKSK